MVVSKKGDVNIHDRLLIATVDEAKDVPRAFARMAHGGPCLAAFSFSHSREGYEMFMRRIREFGRHHGCTEILVGFESTGVYSSPLSYYLMTQPVKAVQVNPMHTKRARELPDNSPNKTDHKDPKVIYTLIEMKDVLTVLNPVGAEAELRAAALARERAQEDLTSCFNRLHALVFQGFPEFFKCFKSLRCVTAQHLLRTYPRPIDLVACGAEKLAADLRRISRGRKGTQEAWHLIADAKSTIGVNDGRASRTLEIQHLLKRIAMIEEESESYDRRMKALLPHVPYSNNLMSIKGMGELTTATLIGHLGHIPSFHSSSAILKYSGLNIFEISSGKHKGLCHITKRGRSSVRRTLFFTVLRMIKKGGLFHEEYHRMIDQTKKTKIEAMVALMRKLLGVIYALVRDGTLYDENYTSQHDVKMAA